MDVETTLGKEIPASDSAGARIEAADEPGVGVEVPSPLRTMTPFWKVDWAALRTVKPTPIEFLRRQGVRLYLRVDTEQCVAYVYRALHGPYEGLTAKGFVSKQETIGYLALDNKALSELAVSGVCNRSEFTEGGLIVVEGDESGPATVKDATFQRCYILDSVDKVALETPTVPPGPNPDFREKAVDFLIREEDLWLEQRDLARIREADLLSGELIEYPYDHRHQVPAVYEMFQAAYGLNGSETLTVEGASKLLKCDHFSVKRRAFAMKFVQRNVDRSRGRAGRDGAKPLAFDEALEWASSDRTFVFPYVSRGLTIILAVTDWWSTLRSLSPRQDVTLLANQLLAFNFDETEVEHLVWLIAGVSLRKAEAEVGPSR
jgi:hypothetical protein